MQNISAIILAAGHGSRIGQPKWQLQYQGKTFLEIIVNNLFAAQIDKVVCVARADSIPSHPGIKIVINPNPGQGMLSSVYYGIKTASKSSGYLIMPVDHPFVQVATFIKLQQTFFADSECVICPTYCEHKGHPIILPQILVPNFGTKIWYQSLRDFLGTQNVRVKLVRVDDNGVLRNINTKNDLQEIIA